MPLVSFASASSPPTAPLFVPLTKQSVTPSEWESSMSLTAIVRFDNGKLADSGILGAFVGDVVRGANREIAILFGPYNGAYAFMLMIYGELGDSMSFQFDTGTERALCDETVFFKRDGIIGDVFAPFELQCHMHGTIVGPAAISRPFSPPISPPFLPTPPQAALSPAPPASPSHAPPPAPPPSA